MEVGQKVVVMSNREHVDEFMYMRYEDFGTQREGDKETVLTFRG